MVEDDGIQIGQRFLRPLRRLHFELLAPALTDLISQFPDYYPNGDQLVEAKSRDIESCQVMVLPILRNHEQIQEPRVEDPFPLARTSPVVVHQGEDICANPNSRR